MRRLKDIAGVAAWLLIATALAMAAAVRLADSFGPDFLPM